MQRCILDFHFKNICSKFGRCFSFECYGDTVYSKKNLEDSDIGEKGDVPT